MQFVTQFSMPAHSVCERSRLCAVDCLLDLLPAVRLMRKRLERRRSRDGAEEEAYS